MESFGVEIRTIRAGRPMANGQAESAVKLMKTKLKLMCLQNSNLLYIIGLHYFLLHLMKYHHFQ